GHAADRREHTTIFDLAHQLLGRWQADSVCHDVDWRERLKSGLIVESHHLISADAFGRVQLSLSNAGNNDRAFVFGRAYGGAANAADGARNQNRLTGLDATRYGDELIARDRDERERGCFD